MGKLITPRNVVWLAIVMLVLHSTLLAFTEFSLVGYKSDVLLPFGAMLALVIAMSTLESGRLKKSSRILVVFFVCMYSIGGFSGWSQRNVFKVLNVFDVESFCYYSINGELYHGYFEPVGASSGGEGNFWITKSPTGFPILELEIYNEHAILWNFSSDEFDGRNVDQNEIMRQTILEVISR